MKDYSNYHSNSIDKIKYDAKVLASATFRGLESETVLINGQVETVIFIYDKYSGTESLKYIIDENKWVTYGDVIHRENGEKWLVRNYEKDNPLYKQWISKICQYTLKWYDENSVLHEYPCVMDYNTKSNFGERDDRVMSLPDGRRQIILRKDDNTIKLQRTKRFILGNEVFEVVDYDFISDFGLVNLSLKSSQLDKSKDNLELGIADYYQHQFDYYLSVPDDANPISINVNQSLKLDIKAYKNGQQVNVNEINLSSTNEQIGTIDNQGVFTPHNAGSVKIIAEYMGITKTIEILVRDILVNNYSIEFIGSDSISLGQSREITAQFRNNGQPIDESCEFLLFAEDGVSTTDLASISFVTGNIVRITANSKSKTGYVVLKVKSTNNIIHGDFKIRIKGFM